MPRMTAIRRLRVSTFTLATSSQRAQRRTSQTLNLFLPATAAQINGAGDAWVITKPALVSMYSGTADKNDPSHFTLPYKVNGQGGVIDGWLHADGPTLRPRTGEAVNFGGGERAWNLIVPPAPQPQRW
jgi:hypothetical protein